MIKVPETTAAYLAGALDADGHFTIKKSSYRIRKMNDCVNFSYYPMVGIGQVTPEVPELMKSIFGGTISLNKPATENSRPIYRYQAYCKNAITICDSVLPYLLLKKDRATALTELQNAKDDSLNKSVRWWWENENPNWRQTEKMIGPDEACRILGYSNPSSLSQAIRNKTICCLDLERAGHSIHEKQKRFPEGLIIAISENRPNTHGKSRKGPSTPRQLISIYERLWQKVREMNKIGINGTCVNRRTGHHAPIAI